MEIFIAKPGGQKEGPFTLDQINQDIATSKYSFNDYWAWHEGMPQWVPLYQIPGIQTKPAPPPPAPKPAPVVASKPEPKPTPAPAPISAAPQAAKPTSIAVSPTQQQPQKIVTRAEPTAPAAAKPSAPAPVSPTPTPLKPAAPAPSPVRPEVKKVDPAPAPVAPLSAMPPKSPTPAQPTKIILPAIGTAKSSEMIKMPDETTEPPAAPAAPAAMAPAQVSASPTSQKLAPPPAGAHSESSAVPGVIRLPATPPPSTIADDIATPVPAPPVTQEKSPAMVEDPAGLPFAALEQIFVFTTGEGRTLFESQTVARKLEQITGAALKTVREMVHVDIIGRANVGVELMLNKQVPDKAWRAMFNIRPVVAQGAKDDQYRVCTRAFTTEANDTVAVLLFYNNQKI